MQTTTVDANGVSSSVISLEPAKVPDALFKSAKTGGGTVYDLPSTWDKLRAYGFRASAVTVETLKLLLETGALRRMR